MKKVKQMNILHQTLWQNIVNTQTHQVKYYNDRHIRIAFNVKDRVMLNKKNLRTFHSYKKLNDKFHDPFHIK